MYCSSLFWPYSALFLHTNSNLLIWSIGCCHVVTKWCNIVLPFCRLTHSMARANLNKSKFFLTFTTTASKYMKSPLSDPKVPLNVNIVKQVLLNKKQFLKWGLKGGFPLIKYFNYVVAEAKKNSLQFIQVGSGHTVVTW